jgi:hypothetical protein
MRPDVARDLSDSAYDFVRVVWPAIKDACGGGDLQPVEAVAPKEFEKQLDTLAGIDAWQIINGKGIRGISSRVQWPDKGPGGIDGWWETFTIRASRSNGSTTELEKRIRALKSKSGFIRPALLVHAYVQKPRREGLLNYVCMVRADELFALATEEHAVDVWYSKTNPADGNKFSVFEVIRLRENGIKVFDACPARERAELLSWWDAWANVKEMA